MEGEVGWAMTSQLKYTRFSQKCDTFSSCSAL